jgi:hypothetical protein
MCAALAANSCGPIVPIMIGGPPARGPRGTSSQSYLPPIRLPDRMSELRLLLEAREDLVAESTRARNRLHAHLLSLAPGYGGTVANLVAARHRATVGRLLRGVGGARPSSPADSSCASRVSSGRSRP